MNNKIKNLSFAIILIFPESAKSIDVDKTVISDLSKKLKPLHSYKLYSRND